MAHGLNAASKANRVRNSAKGWFKTHKQELYMTDREAIAWDIAMTDGLTQEELNQACYSEYADAYLANEYDNEIYGYDRRERNVFEGKLPKRRHIFIGFAPVSQAA